MIALCLGGCQKAELSDKPSSEGENSGLSTASAQTVSNAEVLKKLEEFGKKLEQIDEIRADLVTFQSKLNSPVDFDSLSHSNSEKVVRIQKTDSNLLDASAIGDLLRVNELLSQGIDPNPKDKNGKTPLHYAAANGRTEIIKALVGAGAKINELDNDKLTPLNRAQFIGNQDAMKVLIENNAVAAVIINPATAKNVIKPTREEVLQSIEQDSIDLFKKQEKLGFDFNSELPGNQSLIIAAAKNGSVNVLRHYFENYKHKTDPRNSTVIVEALNSMSQRAIGDNADQLMVNYRQTIELLAKILPESVNFVKDGYSPLHMAIGTHDVDMIKILMEAKGDFEQKGPNGRTPLVMAVTAQDHIHGNDSSNSAKDRERHGHQLEMVKLLLNEGADINQKGYKGRDAFMEAIKTSNSELIELMLNSGGNPNSVDIDGVTCLHLAAYSGDMQLCEQLIARNANKDAMVKVGPKKGLKPIDAARERKHQHIVSMLQVK